MIRLVLGLLFAICLAPDVAEPRNLANPLLSHDTSKEQDSKNCQRCQAGYFQQKTCEIPEGKPVCSPCPFGTFMKFPNNERKCHKWKECSKVAGFEEKTPCNRTNDRECRCMSGMFQDRDGEICSKCKDCDGGKVEKECTENEDTVCSPVRGDEAKTDKPLGIHPDKKTDSGVGLSLGLGLILVVVVLLVLGLCWIFCKRKKKNSLGNEGNENEIAKVSRQINEMTAGKDLPGNWKEIVKMNVHLPEHRKLVRNLGLEDCKIKEIQNDYPYADEQKYELLCAWENQIGNDSNKLKKVVEGLYSCEQGKTADVLVQKATQSTVEEQPLLE